MFSAQATRQGLSGGAIAGIVVGCVAVVSLIVACVWLRVAKRKRGRERDESTKEAADEKVQCHGLYSSDPELMAVEICELPAKHGLSEIRDARMTPELEDREYVHKLPSRADR
jgi:hypothetical protein